MALRITIDVFSGRPNPAVELTGRPAADALRRLRPIPAKVRSAPRQVLESRLGYRGLIIEQAGDVSRSFPRKFRLAAGNLIGGNLRHRPSDATFEEFICGSVPRGLPKGFRNYCLGELKALLEWWDRIEVSPTKWPPLVSPCQCAPVYEPAWWNDGAQRQLGNNCYNYATNYRTDTFAQPGRAAGQIYGSLSCVAVRPAAERDQLLTQTTRANACPASGHLVALVIAPGWDFHWYRKGQNGYWSHKPGSTPVTNLDNSGITIPDPRTANRGSYTDFCTFMIVRHGHIKIN